MISSTYVLAAKSQTCIACVNAELMCNAAHREWRDFYIAPARLRDRGSLKSGDLIPHPKTMNGNQ